MDTLLYSREYQTRPIEPNPQPLERLQFDEFNSFMRQQEEEWKQSREMQRREMQRRCLDQTMRNERYRRELMLRGVNLEYRSLGYDKPALEPVPELNVENCLKLADHLEKNVLPQNFSQAAWNTCIAGHCVDMMGQRASLEDIRHIAKRFLGVGDCEAMFLFAAEVRPSYNNPRAAAKVLRYLAETGAIDWERANKGA